jgi:hypothetical protein
LLLLLPWSLCSLLILLVLVALAMAVVVPIF